LLRSFLAIELPGTILQKIEGVQEDLKSSHADVRWVNPENIHLTLKFLGNIEGSRIEPVAKAVEEAILTTSPFPLIIRGMGAFPHLKNPRVIWVGVVDGNAMLVPFQRQLEIQFEKIGFQAEDRPFHPHLTLGRTKSSRGKEELVRRIEKHKDEEFGDLQVESVLLFKSDLRPTGPIYTPLRKLMVERR
jgi:2'-5' RNA ligase